MAANRHVIHLDQLYEFASGLSKPRSEFGEGFPFLSFRDVFYNTFVPRDLSQLVKSSETERQSLSIKRGDVFLTRTSETVDELGMSCVALTNVPNATFNGFTKRLRPKSQHEVVPEYAGYFFRSPGFRNDVYAMSSLSTRASLNNEMLARLVIVLPSLDEQTAIGQVLKALDDKIELNRRMNETLEAMARSLFQSWFVDFDPVCAKVGGRSSDLPEAFSSVFSVSLSESELGDIPSDWRVGELQELASVLMGLSPDGESYNANGIGTPLINGPVEFGDYFPVRSKWTTAPSRLTEFGDLVFCVRGSTTGRRVVADGVYCLGRGVCALRSITAPRAYLY
ncbi:MAG: restriction endonuclease subunit S, partial [Bradyrhizobium sp.]|nr:restriction endonuclease subunit S [Bradyrhizobium sp.]